METRELKEKNGRTANKVTTVGIHKYNMANKRGRKKFVMGILDSE